MTGEWELLTPTRIAAALDQFIIGQSEAKKAVAVALRSRMRRRKLPAEMAEEIIPKNILMIGPTGVGKTEIARRLAKLVSAPFLKVEATKYTEVGYVGRDVESMVRDLFNVALQMVKSEMAEANRETAEARTEERILDLLLNIRPDSPPPTEADKEARERFRRKLRNGDYEQTPIRIRITENKPLEMTGMFAVPGMPDGDDGSRISDIIGDIFAGKRKTEQKLPVCEAREILLKEETEKLVENGNAVKAAKERTEQSGIIFIDEIDKLATTARHGSGEVSREGVQRDLLPIIEGSKINTKYGLIDTSHILFIAAGAFHMSKPSDLMPELQGRLPVRVELKSLTPEDFYRILTEPQNALIKQYTALMETEGVALHFEEAALRRLSQIAAQVNRNTEDIGARRLYTIMERLLEDLSFAAETFSGRSYTVTEALVDEKLSALCESQDLSAYIL